MAVDIKAGINYAPKPAKSYVDWTDKGVTPGHHMVAVDQAKFNLSWLAFPSIDKEGVSSLPKDYVDSLHQFMDKDTREALTKPPLVFMRYWWKMEAKYGVLPLSTYMARDYKTTMLIRANIAQARLVVVDGNVITPEFWKKAA